MSNTSRAEKRSQRMNWVKFQLISMESHCNLAYELRSILNDYSMSDLTDATMQSIKEIEDSLGMAGLEIMIALRELAELHTALIEIDKIAATKTKDTEDGNS